MAKINIDIEKINNKLIPSSNSLLSSIKNAYNMSLTVRFPDDDFGWNNAVSRLDDCVESTVKYLNWVDSMRNDYTRVFTDCIDSFISNNDSDDTEKREM